MFQPSTWDYLQWSYGMPNFYLLDWRSFWFVACFNAFKAPKYWLGLEWIINLIPNFAVQKKYWKSLYDRCASPTHSHYNSKSFEISQDLLGSHKIYRDLTRSADLTWHFTFDTFPWLPLTYLTQWLNVIEMCWQFVPFLDLSI